MPNHGPANELEYDLMKYKLTSDALGIALWDMDIVSGDPVNPNNKITWSNEFRRMLGFSDEGEFPNLLHSWSDRLHPEDKERTLKSFIAHLDNRSGGTPYNIEYRLMTKNGDYRNFHAFGTTLRDKEGIPLRVAGALQDITEKKHMLETLKRREKMTSTINSAAIMFLSQAEDTFLETMTAGVRLIVDMVKLDRFSLWRNLARPDGLHASQIYRWDRASGGTTIPTPGLEDVSYAKLAPRWEKLLASDEIVNSPARLLPEADMLKSFGVVSAFVTPVFINNAFWGFALFEDRHNERYFDEESAEMMLSAAFLCTNTVIMKDKTKSAEKAMEALKRREKMLGALNEMAEMLLSHKTESFDEVLSSSLKPVAVAAGIDRVAVYRLLDGNIQLGQIYLWKGQTIALEDELLVLPDVPPVKRWLEILTKGECINRNVRDMPEDEAEFASYFGVKSIFFVPIFIGGEFWGTITLEDHTNYRYFDEEYLDLLRSAAHLCASAVVRGEMEREIAAANELTRDVTEASPISYVLFDENLCPIDCNEAMMRILACPDKQYLLDNYWGAFLPDSQPDGLDSFEKANAKKDEAFSGGQSNFEWMHRSLNGELIPMENTLTRVTHQGKKYIISFKYDLRNTKKMMENIREQGELLKDALEKATVASKAKGDFLSNMSHEMRTPLNAIIGMTAIGKKADDLERKDYALDKIGDASAHLLGVINDVLDMSKIEANKLELSFIEFDFEKVLQKAVTVINFRVEEKHQKLTVRIDRAIPRSLIGDDQRLTQVITNLLANAVKFTPEKGAISLDAKLVKEENCVCNIQITVKDTGIGISADQQSSLFQSFQQAESDTERKYGGTGLGLAISKSIVEMMGGIIWVKSELGKGSTFAFTIHLKRGEDRKYGLLNESINWSNVRIMAVDDDPDVLVFFRETMHGFGVSCDTASSGEEALRLVEQGGSYNIYFIDFKMPILDGIELTRILKKKAQSPGNSVVIMISATDRNEIEEDAKKAGVDKFLSKPLFSSSIMDIVNESFGVGQPEELPDISGLFAGHRILLAEDVEINREIVMGLLEPTQLEIDCAENGAEAVRIYSEAPQNYDMVFMDVHMPQMDGYEATRKIREFEAELRSANSPQMLERPEGVPIVAMTANVFREDVEKCLSVGMNGHIGKPLNFEEVLDKLRCCLLGSRQ